MRAAAAVAALFSAVAGALAILHGQAVIAIFAALGASAAALSVWLDLRDTRRSRARHREAQSEIATLRSDLKLDQLTGHLNRSAFTAVLTDLARSDSRSTLVSLYFFDLNRFKEVNDTLGHEIGDLLLRGGGETRCRGARRANSRSTAWAARIRRDHPVSRREARRAFWAQALVDVHCRSVSPRRRCVEVSASVGVAIGDAAVHGGDECCAAPIPRCMRSRAWGGGLPCLRRSAVQPADARTRSAQELPRARFEERFELHYNRSSNARNGMIEKAEALLRSQDHA